MLDQDYRNYIEANFLRANEEIDEYQLSEWREGLWEVPIVKRTAKRRKRTRLLLVQTMSTGESEACRQLSKVFTGPGVKKHLPSEQGDFYLQQGLVMKLLDFESDEKSIKSQTYVMGLPLFRYIQQQKNEQKAGRDAEILGIEQRYSELGSIPYTRTIPGRSEYITMLDELFEELLAYLKGDSVKKEDSFYRWRWHKQMQFLHFIVAYLHMMKTQELFDWKEIGARYYGMIGGSKQFDPYKHDFLQVLEERGFPPVSVAGLQSFGSIAHISFSGSIQGSMSSFRHGCTHSVTDQEVFVDTFRTDATHLWLVENRGILTRFTSEKDFLKETNSLMIAVDGQLRSAVKRLIGELAKCSSIQTVLVWTDYDEAGIQIARSIYETIKQTEHAPVWKWIVPGKDRVVTDFDTYRETVQACIRLRQSEQEEELGGADEWRKWIQH
ncbi:DUF2399 domain-containing protein [Bacillus testis]|uniref:DUF2399 domain-containing protein n=1 Tax=Bacillus testis TaxID=1622072 RepID=UPI00067F0455|nr:DUF2399 domain-containing protein [Bacillus testis]